MTVPQQIADYMTAQPERKRDDMHALHGVILGLMPDCRLWFLDGKDAVQVANRSLPGLQVC